MLQWEEAARLPARLLQVGREVHRELLDRRVVELLELLEQGHVLGVDEVDSNSLAAVTARATNAVEVVLLVRRQVEVDHDGNVLHVNATGQQVRRDQHTRRARPEDLHHLLTLALRHVGVHERHGELLLVHLLGQPVDLPPRVAEDHGLRDRHGVVQVHEGLELELLLHGHVELLDTLERQLLLLHQDADRLTHELLREVQDLRRHRGGEQADLHVLGQELEDLVDLLGEALREHLVGLVKAQALQVVRLQGRPLDDVEDTARGADRDQHSLLELLKVVRHTRATHEGVAEGTVAQVLADGGDNSLRLHGQLARRREDQGLAVAVRPVHALQETDRERTGLARSGLRLGDQVTSLDERDDGTLLDSRRLLETVRVNSAEQVGVQRHLVERRADLDVIGERRVLEGVVVLRLMLGSGLGLRHCDEFA
eukprot:Rhum_TRINITY_DN14363_c0_g1::Rhum_TRINITY_DN14363_c0_g1_i2::g.84527::m.84527